MSRPQLRIFVELLDYFEVEFFHVLFVFVKKRKKKRKKGKKDKIPTRKQIPNPITKPSKTVPSIYL